MEAIKAVCSCRNMSEENTVLAIQQGRFAFVEKWGFFTWLMAGILVISTGTMWIGAIIGWHGGDIFKPKYYCNQCGALVQQQQFRA